jgi:hypothetical protein
MRYRIAVSRLALLGAIVIANHSCPLLRGGVMTFTGSEARFWDTHAAFVVKVVGTGASLDPRSGATGSMHVQVIMVIATDRPIATSLDLDYFFGGLEAADRQFTPAVNETYIVCAEQWHGDWIISGGPLGLLDSGGAVQQISGLKDRILRRAEKRIEWARRRSLAREFENETERKHAENAPDPAPPRPK